MAAALRWSSGCTVLGRLWGDTPCPRAKWKPQNDGRRGEITFRIKPRTCQRCSEGSNKPWVDQDPQTHRDSDRNVFECLLWRYGSAVDCCRGRGSGYSRSGYGISPIGAARSYTGLGKQTLGGHRQNLMHTRTQEEGAVTPTRDWPRLACECLEVSGRVMGRWWSAAGWGALSIAVSACDLLKEVVIIFIIFIIFISTIVWPQVK